MIMQPNMIHTIDWLWKYVAKTCVKAFCN